MIIDRLVKSAVFYLCMAALVKLCAAQDDLLKELNSYDKQDLELFAKMEQGKETDVVLPGQLMARFQNIKRELWHNHVVIDWNENERCFRGISFKHLETHVRDSQILHETVNDNWEFKVSHLAMGWLAWWEHEGTRVSRKCFVSSGTLKVEDYLTKLWGKVDLNPEIPKEIQSKLRVYFENYMDEKVDARMSIPFFERDLNVAIVGHADRVDVGFVEELHGFDRLSMKRVGQFEIYDFTKEGMVVLLDREWTKLNRNGSDK